MTTVVYLYVYFVVQDLSQIGRVRDIYYSVCVILRSKKLEAVYNYSYTRCAPLLCR